MSNTSPFRADQSRFVALTNLAVLFLGKDVRDGLQLKSSSPANRLDAAESEVPARRIFLNRLSELISRQKDVKLVTCAVMSEINGSTKIWVARNEGFSENDKTFFRKFESIMMKLAHDPVGEAGESECFRSRG
jgi:hypothetical protein